MIPPPKKKKHTPLTRPEKKFTEWYRLLAIQPNKGLANLCKNYQHYYSCVRTKNCLLIPDQTRVCICEPKHLMYGVFCSYSLYIFSLIISSLKTHFPSNKTQQGFLLLFYKDKHLYLKKKSQKVNYKGRTNLRAGMFWPQNYMDSMNKSVNLINIFVQIYNPVWSITQKRFLFLHNYRNIESFSAKRPNPCSVGTLTSYTRK